MNRVLPIAVLSALLAGCANVPGMGTTAAGGAVYTYQKNADGTCSASVTSSREVGEAEVTISECDMSVETSSLGGADAAMQTINTLIQLLMEGKAL